MAIATLNRAQAFGPGSDLWVIPDKSNFTFFSKLDWYLNFQLTRAHLHRPQILAPQLKNISNENSLPSFDIELKSSAPLMISAEMGLPTKIVVEMPLNSEPTTWIIDAHQTWLKLDRPTLRVFLPGTIDMAEFKAKWPGKNTEDITVVQA